MKNNVLKGKILKLLAEIYPEGIEHTSLLGIYHSYEKVDDIIRSVAYLADRGLVERKEVPHPYKANTTVIYYKILPDGLNLVEGNSPADSGIVVPVEA